MAVRSSLVAMLLGLAGPVLAGASPPDTPAGHALAAWLDAMNSDERARQEAFIKDYPTFGTLDDLMNWRAGVGGYELLEVIPTDPTNVFFRVRQKSAPVEEVGRLQVTRDDPRGIAAIGAWRVPPGARFEPVMLDDAARTGVVERIADTLQAFHVDAAMGTRLAAELRARNARGEYRNLRYLDSLAGKLTEDLRALGHDAHLEVRFDYFVRPPGSPEVDAAQEAKRLAAVKCGFEKAELLPHHIGYVKIDGFEDPASCASAAGAAMNLVADSDALVLDLRDNRGGRAEMVALLAGHLFAGRTHLSDSYRRADASTRESWTPASVPGKKFLRKPVFVLISSRTFSAGEALAFLLQAQRRATLIGEATVGGSGAIEFRRIDEHFTLVLPTIRVTSPVTGNGWAGTGVQPDVKVPADQALDAALGLARK